MVAVAATVTACGNKLVNSFSSFDEFCGFASLESSYVLEFWSLVAPSASSEAWRTHKLGFLLSASYGHT